MISLYIPLLNATHTSMLSEAGSTDAYGNYYPNQAQQGYQDNSDSLVALGGGAGSGVLDNSVDNYQNNTNNPYSNNPYQNNSSSNDAVYGSALVPAQAGELVSFGEGAPQAPPSGNSGTGAWVSDFSFASRSAFDPFRTQNIFSTQISV